MDVALAIGSMMRLFPRTRNMLRTYSTVVLLNLAVVSGVLAPHERQRPAHVRILAGRSWRERETVRFSDGSVGVICIPPPPGNAVSISLN